MSGVFIFPATPGLEESVANGLRPGDLMSLGLVCRAKKESRSAIAAAMSIPTLLDLWATECVCSGTETHPSSLLLLLPRPSTGSGLRRDPGLIVICDTILKKWAVGWGGGGGAAKSAVIVASRPTNEASAFTLLFIECCSGTLCSLFTDS